MKIGKPIANSFRLQHPKPSFRGIRGVQGPYPLPLLDGIIVLQAIFPAKKSWKKTHQFKKKNKLSDEEVVPGNFFYQIFSNI